jgi:ankyrin repeat protein
MVNIEFFISNFYNCHIFKKSYFKAAAYNRNNIVDQLIEAGADLEASNDDGVTSLMLGKTLILSKISYYIIINKSS